MQQSKMTLGGVMAAGIIASAAAVPEQACFINLLSADSAVSPDNIEYICQNFEEAMKDGTLLSPCGTNEQAYNMYSLICGTTTPTPFEETATPVSTWTLTTTSGPNASEDITPFEVVVTTEATPSETYTRPTTFEKITGCTSDDMIFETTSPESVVSSPFPEPPLTSHSNDPATSATPATPATPSETEDFSAGGLSMQDIRMAPVLMACLGLCALLW